MLANRAAPLALLCLVAAAEGTAQTRSSRIRHEREWRVKAEKMDRHLLPTMRKHGIDMWVLMSRENHPDPILDLFGGFGVSGWYGHRNAYIFFDPSEGQSLESTVIGAHLSEHLKRFYSAIVPYGEEGLEPYLERHVRERDPAVIAVNKSRTISMADGLTASLEGYLLEAIGETYAKRLVSSEPMVIDFVSRRTDGEIEIEREASWKTYHLLRRAFSNEVVTPGETSLMDVYWWIVDEWKAQDLELNFPPGLDIQRRGEEAPLADAEDPVIQPGDLLHVDFGVKLMGLVTDQQKMGYVMLPGETQAPAGMTEAFLRSVRLGEIIEEELQPGVFGYVVKERAEKRGIGEGIRNSVYPHSQGNWVHGAGAWVSFDWPERYGQHPREPVRSREIWSIEYSVSMNLPKWDGQAISMLREEDAWVDDYGQVHYFAGPQESLWLIRTEPRN